jgi:hypothetical protein
MKKVVEAKNDTPHGCICPPGAEVGCQGRQCPRRAPPNGTLIRFQKLEPARDGRGPFMRLSK